MTDQGEQNEPVLDEGRSGSSEAPEQEKLQGIVDQTTADISVQPDVDAEHLLRSRLSDAGVEVDDARFAALLADVRGDARSL